MLVHLKEPLMDARVHASGEESLDLQAFTRQEMLIVSVTTVKSDAASVPERWRGQILHGVVSEELPLGPSFIKLTQQELHCVRREEGDKARKGCVGARVILSHDRLARGAKAG